MSPERVDEGRRAAIRRSSTAETWLIIAAASLVVFGVIAVPLATLTDV